LIIWPLYETLTAQKIIVEPLLVPGELERSGMTSVVAAQQLRDALQGFAERANAPVHASQLAAPNDLPEVRVAGLDDLPDFVVPTAGLSVEKIAAYIRAYLPTNFPIRERRIISGEITLLDNQLRLRLRLNRRAFYESPSGVVANKVDQLFAMAADRVTEVTDPYLSAAALADKDPDRAIEVAERNIADCPTSDTSANCQEPRQAAKWHNLIGSILNNMISHMRRRNIIRPLRSIANLQLHTATLLDCCSTLANLSAPKPHIAKR
jgi:hypothetical protein